MFTITTRFFAEATGTRRDEPEIEAVAGNPELLWSANALKGGIAVTAPTPVAIA